MTKSNSKIQIIRTINVYDLASIAKATKSVMSEYMKIKLNKLKPLK